MYRKYNDNDSSDEEGFQQAVIKVIDNKAPSVTALLQSVKMQDAKAIIQKKVFTTSYSIYQINMIITPPILFHPLQQAIVKMNKKQTPQNPINTDIKDMGQFLKSNNFVCKYNKFDTKLDYKSDMTSLYKSFEFYLQYQPNHYKQFSAKDGVTNESIQFSSNFQCGNLQFVFTNNESTYYLLLQNDTNTHGYTHWFYFRIKNKRKCKIKIIIINIVKPIHLFSTAMGISIFSTQQKSFCRKYWTEGNNVKMYKNNFKRKNKNNKKLQYHTIQFDYEFKFQSDTVYFAMNIPYSYTKLTTLFDEVSKRKQHTIINTKIIGKTVGNNNIYCLEFTKNNKDNFIVRRKSSAFMQNQQITTDNKQIILIPPPPPIPQIKKKAIVLLGRQHPCQTNSSYILEGIINFFVEESDASLFLLEHYEIYIIPMMNPDGVIHGNSRTNLCGYDINREWSQPDISKSKEVYLIHKFIKDLQSNIEIKYIIDFHSHSKKLNTFGYFSQDSLQSHAFAWFLEDSNPNFDYSSCTFGLDKSKQKTLRYFTYHLGIKNSITIETSFFGKQQHGLFRRYNTKQLHDIGITIMKAIGQFSEIGVPQVIMSNYLKSNIQKNKFYQQLSQSQPEEDYLDERQRVKIILQARRQKQSQLPARLQNRRNSMSKNKPFKLSSLNKTMINLNQDRSKNKSVSSMSHKGSFNIHSVQKPFKRYSQQQMLKDDSDNDDDTNRKFLTQTSAKRFRPKSQSRSKLYLWDEQKYSVSKLVSYPTSLHPNASTGYQSEGGSPVKSRKQFSLRYNETSESELQKLISDSKKRQHQKYEYIANQEKRRKCKLSKYLNKKLISFAMSVNSLKDLKDC